MQKFGDSFSKEGLQKHPREGLPDVVVRSVVEMGGEFLTANGVTQVRHVMPTRSYLSQVELPLTFGLGTAQDVERVEVRWPDGTTEVVEDVPIDRLTEITQSAPAG